ncbi:MAG: glycosyltransferase [Bacteroidetes bacterium]|nr:glycosyltransferase [Bacteroidota bacterium]
MRIIISVVSDLVTDQRVHRTATTLSGTGHEVILVGRRKGDSQDISRSYKTVRFKLWWEKGALFYGAYNLRLFFFLLFNKVDVLVSNDLDTLLPNYLISKLKGAKLYYDAHEYFTEVPELVSRPKIQKIWKSIERWIFPKLAHVWTVNDSIAKLYSDEYRKEVGVIRNVPFSTRPLAVRTRAELNLPADKKILLFQGAGINIDRGGEEAVEAMQYLDNCLLLFIGGGDVMNRLKEMAVQFKVAEKVRFIARLPFHELQSYTALADIGLSLDKDTNINYRYSLPNKIFDYIHAGLPVLSSNLLELRKIVDGYKVGMIAESHNPVYLAERIKEMLSDEKRFDTWKENLKLAAAELCWEKEEQKLLQIFRDVL